jgi:hypothetical protein
LFDGLVSESALCSVISGKVFQKQDIESNAIACWLFDGGVMVNSTGRIP